jgi:antitoxin component of RelBE/YafQ-DinJ toxin-antitoxin module
MTKQTTIIIDNKPYPVHIPENLRLESQRLAQKLGLNFSSLVRYALSKLIIEMKK